MPTPWTLNLFQFWFVISHFRKGKHSNIHIFLYLCFTCQHFQGSKAVNMDSEALLRLLPKEYISKWLTMSKFWQSPMLWKNSASRHILRWTFVTRKGWRICENLLKNEWIRLPTGQKSKKKTGLHWQQFRLLKKSERLAIIWSCKSWPGKKERIWGTKVKGN